MTLILWKKRTVMMTIMSHQPARAGSPASLGQLTHPLTSSWDLWSPRLTRILRFFLSCQGCLRAIEKATKIRHGLLRDLSFVFLFVLLSDVSRKIWAPVHSSTWPESFVIQVSIGWPSFNPPTILPTHLLREGVRKKPFFGTLSQTMGRWGFKVPNKYMEFFRNFLKKK